jgi:hypothetical protein
MTTVCQPRSARMLATLCYGGRMHDLLRYMCLLVSLIFSQHIGGFAFLVLPWDFHF